MARFVLAAALLLSACRGSSRAPGPEDDAPLVRTILAAEDEADRAIKEAEAVEVGGDDARAAELLEAKAVPAADAAIRVAEQQAPATAWGRARKEELLGVLRERRAALPDYAKALRSGDKEAKVAAMTQQIEIERRVRAAAARAKER